MVIVDEPNDVEWYLRHIAEDELVRGAWGLLSARARALIAVGRIPAAQAVAIVRAYQQAHSLRGRYDEDLDRAEDASPVEAAIRVSLCPRTFQQPWGTVQLHHVVWTGQETRLSATVTETSPGAGPVSTSMPTRYRGAHFRGGRFHGGPPSLTVIDENGRKHEGHFSGGGSGDEWSGRFTLEPGLDADASWFTIYGERVELAPNPSDVTVRLVPSPSDATEADLAEQYLTFCLESPHHEYADSVSTLQVAIDTFVATSVLAADSAVIRGIQNAREALTANSPFGRRRGRRKASDSPDLPARWRSVLARRGRTDGIVGGRGVGAITPSFDGIVVCVTALRSRADDFEVELDAAFATDPLQSDENMQQRFAVSAFDDRGNHYLGEVRDWSGSDTSMFGTIAFQAPLDPSATTVELHLSAGGGRAVVTVPLRWAGPA